VTNLLVRPAVESDAAQFVDLWDALDTETEFMLFEPGERKVTPDNQKLKLAASKNSVNNHILVLEDEHNSLLGGFCAGSRSQNFRDKHALYIVIGIRQQYVGKGWGHKLLNELEQWARQAGVTRLELSVMVHNTRALALYSNFGFKIEGTKKNAVCLRSGFVDEHIMAKLIY